MRDDTTESGSGREHVQGIRQLLVNLHDRRLVPASVAVVWCTEDRDDVPVLAPAVTYRIIELESRVYAVVNVDVCIRKVGARCR